jgi:intracellular septation protein
MKMLFDLLPVILFFAAFKLKGIFVATAVAIVACVLQIAWMLIRRKKVEPMMWASLAIITIFGGATILLHNETYIKWKPSILYWLMGAALLAGQLFFRKNAMKGLLGKQMTLPDKSWSAMNISWGVFFAVIGCVNLFVAYNFSTDTWVNFKLFGIMGCILVFAVAQSLIIGTKQTGEKTAGNGEAEKKD